MYSSNYLWNLPINKIIHKVNRMPTSHGNYIQLNFAPVLHRTFEKHFPTFTISFCAHDLNVSIDKNHWHSFDSFASVDSCSMPSNRNNSNCWTDHNSVKIFREPNFDGAKVFEKHTQNSIGKYLNNDLKLCIFMLVFWVEYPVKIHGKVYYREVRWI